MKEALITIGDKQWLVTLATSQIGLITGLTGIAMLAENSGMLFDMSSDQDEIVVNMSGMLFALDIVFINSSSGVSGVLEHVQPSQEAMFRAGGAPGARYFLEVSAGEANGVKVGDSVNIGNAPKSAKSVARTAGVTGLTGITLVGTMSSAASALGAMKAMTGM